MQYILTKEEYERLAMAAVQMSEDAENKINNLCVLVAENLPSFEGWNGDEEPRPWGCVHSEKNNPGYCDKCPVEDYCTMEKRFSK